MAVTSMMIQVEVEQEQDTEVASIPEVVAEAFIIFLNGGTITVTEIAVQKAGGVFGHNAAIPIDNSPTGYATLRLFTAGTNEVDFFAPSYVPSPPTQPCQAALLELTDTGFTSPNSIFQAARKLGAHAYLTVS